MLKKISTAAGQVKYTLVGKQERLRAEERTLNPYFKHPELRVKMKPKISMKSALSSYVKTIEKSKFAEANTTLNNARISFMNTLGKAFPFAVEFINPFGAGLGNVAKSVEGRPPAGPGIGQILSEAFQSQQVSTQLNTGPSFGK